MAKQSKEKFLSVCPKCGSADVSFETDPAYAFSGLMSQFKQCNNCGHHGQVFPEVSNSKIPQKTLPIDKIKGRQLVQTSFGKGYYKFFFHVGFILLLIYVGISVLSNIIGF